MTEPTVRDVMTTDVVTATEETGFKEIVTDLYLNRISGVPVIDADRKVVGIVSESDLLRAARERHEPPSRNIFLEWFIDPHRLAEIERLAEDIRAADVMTFDVVCVGSDTPIGKAAATLLRERVKRLPVVDDGGRLIGIITGRDLLQPFLREDEEIAAEVAAEVDRRIDHRRQVHASVENGVVRLTGEVEPTAPVDELLEALHDLDGVVGVENGLKKARTRGRAARAASPGREP